MRGIAAEGFGYRDGDRIGLFAGRRRRTPDPDGAPGSQLAQVLGKNREMVRFAEEGGQVGRQRVDEALPLIATVLLQCIR
jgi:hypothetical protein